VRIFGSPWKLKDSAVWGAQTRFTRRGCNSWRSTPRRSRRSTGAGAAERAGLRCAPWGRAARGRASGAAYGCCSGSLGRPADEQRDLARGDRRLARNRYAVAVAYYEDAWKEAREALQQHRH
jgi:hypothetical protein